MSFLVCEAERQNRTREEMSGVALMCQLLTVHFDVKQVATVCRSLRGVNPYDPSLSPIRLVDMAKGK
jgi:hypothetical protein